MPERSRRHLLDIDDLSDASVQALLDRAVTLSRGEAPRSLGLTAANLFFEPSTRTRVSFELAGQRLGMNIINIELDRSSATKGESLEDSAATLAAMGVDCLVLRHPETGRARSLAGALPAGMNLINAGDGCGEHPSQALLDAATLQAEGVDWPSTRVAIIGDIRHSRVARSGLRLFRRLGVASLRLAGPESMLPAQAPDPEAEIVHDLAEAVRDADVVMMLRVQRERMDSAGWPDPDEYFRRWGLSEHHLRQAAPACRVLHPGPINRGMEIDADVADGPRSRILAQVRMGVFLRMAIFEWLASA